MRAADLPRVMVNELQAYEFPWDEAVFYDCLAGRYEAWVLEAAQGHELLGHYVVQHILDEVHLLNLCVAPAMQSRGLGRWLLDALIVQAREAHAQIIYLEVRTGNGRAQALYRHAGFQEIGRRKAYYPAKMGREDGLVFTLGL
ncbi:MAG: ribosomal protein S18-alanine N-acetyltransferase [Gammaproteobacteria bacterium]|nr:ribosomal protein S18-alanine N-acetyltransferase [Gammaproteobacteria bacterium]